MTRLYQSGWSIRPQLFFVDESSTIDRRPETDTSAVVVSRPSNTGETPEKIVCERWRQLVRPTPPPPLARRPLSGPILRQFLHADAPPLCLLSACSLLALRKSRAKSVCELVGFVHGLVRSGPAEAHPQRELAGLPSTTRSYRGSQERRDVPLDISPVHWCRLTVGTPAYPRVACDVGARRCRFPLLVLFSACLAAKSR